MTEQQHTPGPWMVVTGSVYVAGHGPDDSERIPIANMDREPGNGTYGAERDANARLIASAPDLLAALEPFAAKANTFDPGKFVHDDDFRRAAEAVRKARGG